MLSPPSQMFPTHFWDSARHDSQKNARGFVAMKVANLMTRLAIAYIDEVQGLEHADAWFQISSAGREAESPSFTAGDCKIESGPARA